jgi:hypothetical protein
LKAGGSPAGFFVFQAIYRARSPSRLSAFIAHSRNKTRGTIDHSEHRAWLAVVGVGNAHCEENSMTNRLMISVATLALLAGTGMANAQGAGMSRDTPSAAPAQQSTPAEHGATSERGNATGQMNHESSRPEMKSENRDEKSGAIKNQRAEENNQGPKTKTLSSDNADKAGMKNKETTTGQSTKPENREESQSLDKANRIDQKMGNESEGKNARHTQTTGQAGAGAKLSTEQRTKITTVIKGERIAPVEHVNFSISVGTRVPRDVTFHPLPTEVVTIYPEWRGYEFILVGDQVVVVDPRTFEIVAVLDA